MRTPDVVRMVVLCVCYVATAKFGLSLDALHSVAAAVWPPTGIALMALVLGGCRLWPGITCGAFLANLWAGVPVPAACGIAMGNTLEALVGTMLLQRLVGFSPALDRLRDVLGLVVLAAMLSTLVSATIGVTSGWLGGMIPAAALGKAWRTWWLGDAMGNLVVAPLLFVWSGREWLSRPRLWVVEAVAVCMAVGALSLLVFGDVAPNLIDSPYVLFPALIWAAVRLGPQGALTAMGLVSAIAVWETIRGSGPFTGQMLHENLLMLQAFLSVVAVTTLVLAAVVAERRKADAVVQEQREWLAVTLSSIGDAVIVTDTQGRVTFVNPVAASVTGWPEAEALGKDITAVFQIINEHTRQAVENPIARVLREDTVVGLAPHTLLIARDGVERPIDDSSAPLRAPRGSLLGVVLVFRDITERKRAEAQLTASLREKEILLKEVHHRVKNNLQIVSSLLELQSDALDDAALLAQFHDSQDRIRSMALVHETLYQSQELARLDLARYIHILSAQLVQSYNIDPQRITVRIQVHKVALDMDQAIPCGLILNELLSNAFKYAFPHNHTGAVHVELHADTAQQVALVVRDDGIGFPDEIDFRHTESLGLQLVAMLTAQLQGTIAMERADGTTFTLTFPVRNVEGE